METTTNQEIRAIEMLAPPRKNQPLSDWCRVNGLDPIKINTWHLVCDAYGIFVKPSQSARDILTKQIEAYKATEEKPEEEVTETEVAETNGDLGALIAAHVQKYIKAPKAAELDEEKVIELIKSHGVDEEKIIKLFSSAELGNLEAEKKRVIALINEHGIKRIEIKEGEKITKVEGLVHKQFDEILKALSAGVNLMLVGEAGGGKTMAVEGVAKALSRKFFCQSVGSQTTKSDLMGYMDANGVYRPSIFRIAFEHGGIFLLDEIDAGNANVITCLNAALTNGVCSFPDGMIQKHETFLCVAAANTFGTGASRQYVGRNQLDAASLDRFVVIEFEYDEKLERVISGNDEWVDKVQRIRKAVKGERVVVSPRASINGAKLLAAGFKEEEVLEMTVLKGCNEDMKSKILKA